MEKLGEELPNFRKKQKEKIKRHIPFHVIYLLHDGGDNMEKIKEAILKEYGTQTACAEALGWTRQKLSLALKSDIRVGTLKELMEGMGYKIILKRGKKEIEL